MRWYKEQILSATRILISLQELEQRLTDILANIETRYRKVFKLFLNINVVYVLINKEDYGNCFFNFVNFNQEYVNILYIQMSRQVQSEK